MSDFASKYKWILVIILLISQVRCGTGADFITHQGSCDGYGTSANSSYVLPFAVGKALDVSQGNCSPLSHFGDARYSYDFPVDIGTSIYAARAGQVIGVREDVSDGDQSATNFVYIRHADNTVARYIHLTKDGVSVSLGDNVAQGALIGSSGNSGISTGPHLHFEVGLNAASSVTVPVTFRNAGVNPRGLLSGKSYTVGSFTPNSQ